MLEMIPNVRSRVKLLCNVFLMTRLIINSSVVPSHHNYVIQASE